MYRENRPGRISLASVVSAWSSPSDDGMHHHHHHHHARRPSAEERPCLSAMTALDRSRQASTCSDRSCERMSIDETRELWMCMLELQQRYGCYTSARIDMALDAGDEGVDLMPNRFIIDTLNESVVDLPDEGREMLNRYLAPGSPPSTAMAKQQKWKLWKK